MREHAKQTPDIADGAPDGADGLDAGVSVPRIETEVRQASRYGGMGATAVDDLAAFFDEPEPASDAVLTDAQPAADEPAADAPAADATDAPDPADDHDAAAASDASRPADEPDAADSSDPADESSDFARFARFRAVYESRDGRMRLFEDEHGHLVAVNAARLV